MTDHDPSMHAAQTGNFLYGDSLADKRVMTAQVLTDAFADYNSSDSEKPQVDQLLASSQEVISRAETEQQMDDVREIALTGTLPNAPEETRPYGFHNDWLTKRQRTVELYDNDPNLTRTLLAHEIAGFHGTYSGSLLSILTKGALLSEEQLNATGNTLHTGERGALSSSAKLQEDVAFADWSQPQSLKAYANPNARPKTLDTYRRQLANLDQEIAQTTSPQLTTLVEKFKKERNYIKKTLTFLEENADSEEAELILANYPILYGVTTEGIQHLDWGVSSRNVGSAVAREPYVIRGVGSDIHGEFRISSPTGVSLDRLPVIAAPTERHGQLASILERYNVHATLISSDALINAPKLGTNTAKRL